VFLTFISLIALVIFRAINSLEREFSEVSSHKHDMHTYNAAGAYAPAVAHRILRAQSVPLKALLEFVFQSPRSFYHAGASY